MIALAYLATVAVSLVVLAVALRRRQVSAPSGPLTPVPSAAPDSAVGDVHLLLTVAVRLAERLVPAA